MQNSEGRANPHIRLKSFHSFSSIPFFIPTLHSSTQITHPSARSTARQMASTNIFDLLTDDAQDQEIQIPAAKAAKPAPTTTANKKPAAHVNRPRDNDGKSKGAGRNRIAKPGL